MVRPFGIEEPAPRFSWRYQAGTEAPRGFTQTGYRIQVASSAENLAQGLGDLWDSGKQSGSDTLSIIYAGKPLASATRYHWQATGYDACGNTYISNLQYFETGLLKAEDWAGAKWISAKSQRPATLPAMLIRLKDYSFETRFRILEGAAVVYFRGNYSDSKTYRIELQPGNPGTMTVSRQSKKTETLKEYHIPDLSLSSWHSLRVTLKGGELTFEVNGVPVEAAPLVDSAYEAGSVALGALSLDKKRGLVQYDDFRLMVDGRMLVEESFDNSALSAFQEYFYSNKQYARVKDGIFEVKGINTYLEPKIDLEAPRFRKGFSSKGAKVVRARAYISGLGYYKFWLNGQRMDDYELQPGFARYYKTAYYSVYDLTDKIQSENMLGFELGRGWYAMTTPTLWGETFSNDWMAEPALRVLVTVDYDDGTRQTVISDPSFKTAPGPVLFDSVKAGEIYDARKELPGWDTVAFNDQGWMPAVLAQGKMPSSAPGLTAQLFEPIRVVESFTPVDIKKVEDEPGVWLVDFGKNLAGTVEMKVKAKPGQEIRLAYVEKVHADGAGRDRWNNFAPDTTGAFQRDTYIARGGEEEVYQSSYSYKGFQFVRVEGLAEKPALSQFTAKAINSDMELVGKFRCSSELWNKIWEAGRRCIQSNMHSVPTDCPTWEKLAWTCDDASPFYAMAYNYDLRKLYEKRLQDYADDLSDKNLIRNVVPSSWAKGEDPAWVGSYVNIAWKHFQAYGDKRLIERHYDNLKRYMDTLIQEGQSSEKPPLLTKPRRALGDWVSPDGNVPPEGALIYYNLYFYRYTRMMAEMAKALGRSEDEIFYAALSEDLKKQFHAFHFDEKEGAYYSSNREAGFRQSPQAIALAFGLVPQDKIPVVTSNLVKDIEGKRQGHFWVGILGMEAIADALSENDCDEVAYKAHLKDVYPSLGNMIREGASTLWEDYSSKARSLNHKMFASPLGWMARYVAGLRVDGIAGNGPGFREVLIAPHPVPAYIQFAELEYDSVVGKYHSGWSLTPEGMTYQIVVPPNAVAQFRLPLLGQDSVSISESGKVLWHNGKAVESVPGISSLIADKKYINMRLGSGKYNFSVIYKHYYL